MTQRGFVICHCILLRSMPIVALRPASHRFTQAPNPITHQSWFRLARRTPHKQKYREQRHHPTFRTILKRTTYANSEQFKKLAPETAGPAAWDRKHNIPWMHCRDPSSALMVKVSPGLTCTRITCENKWKSDRRVTQNSWHKAKVLSENTIRERKKVANP